MTAPPRSLIGRLVAAFLLPSLVALVLVASLTYQRAAAALRESVFERLDSIARVKESAFDAWVDHLLRDTVFFSELPEVAELAAILTADDTPPERRRTAKAQLSGLQALAVERAPSFAELFFLAPTGGRILVSTDGSHEGQFRIYDRYYVEGRAGPFVQNVYPSPVTLKPTLTISAPVLGQRGEVLGVLAAHLSLNYLDQNILQRVGLGRTGAVTLVDRHKVLVTGRRYGDRAVGAAPASVAIEEVIRGRSGTGLYRDLGGNDVIGVYRWLEGQELGLLVEIHQQEAFSPARRQALSILGVGSFFLAALIGGIYLAARRIARPILAIAEAAARVQEGDLSSRAPARTADEIGVLATTFNRMVEQLARDAEQRRKAAAEREALISELEAKNAELERFTYTVSHDLKSPLVTIKGFLGFLEQDLESGDDERMQSDFRRIANAADKMSRLLDELLELSRIGRVVNNPEEVSLGELVREVAQEMRQRQGGERAKIDVADDLPVVFGDRVRLREVLENLVENALKFMGPQPAPRVEIGRRRSAGLTVLYVRDNGVGIAPPYREKIFGLFDRLDHSIDGTGVGLAIVRRIIEMHGGRIWVESEGVGHGSTFCFTLGSAPGEPVSVGGAGTTDGPGPGAEVSEVSG